jgi:hypothetical protein
VRREEGERERSSADDETSVRRAKTEITVHNKTFHCSGLYQNLIFYAALLMMDAQETAAHFAERRAAIQGHCLVFPKKAPSAYSRMSRVASQQTTMLPSCPHLRLLLTKL